MPKYTPPQLWQSHFSKHPLFVGYEVICREIEGEGWPNLSKLNALARQNNVLNAQDIPIQFVEQEAPKGQRAYEAQIHQTGMVPTRPENWHDLLNACAWLTWPKLKATLNLIHCLQCNDQHHRSTESDTATLFDESGAVLIGPDPRLAQWLSDHDWQNAFVTHRHLWQSHLLLTVGHAVLEKTLNPYPGMIAKVLYQPYPICTPNQNLSDVVKSLDTLLAQRWTDQSFTKPSDLFALPILGVPGVDALNESSQYYENKKVFRPSRYNGKKINFTD